MKIRTAVILLIFSVSAWAGPAFRYHTVFPEGRLPSAGITDAAGRMKPLRISGNVSISPSGALLLDGKSGYLAVPNSSDISLRKGATLIAVVKFRKNSTGALFYRRGELLCGRSSLRQFYCNISDARIGTPGIKVGDFQHLAVVFTPESKGRIGIQTFVNGKPMTRLRRFNTGSFSAGGADLEFGHAPDRGSAWFLDGEVAEISMYTRQLSQAEIAADIDRFLDNSIIYEPLKGNIGKGKLTGTFRPAGNRRSRRNHAVVLNNSHLKWQTNTNGDWFAEVMIKSLSAPGKRLELMKLDTKKGSWIVELPAKSYEIVLKERSGSGKLSFPSGSLQPQKWMANDAMWHYITVIQKNGKLRFAFDGFYAPGELNANSDPLYSISIGGEGNVLFSDFRLVRGVLTQQELRSRYRSIYQFDDGRTGILDISKKLDQKINRH